MAIRQGSMLVDADGRVKYNWAGLLNGDSGTIVGPIGRTADYTVQASGTFGAGGSATLQGSNDGVNFIAMEDTTGTTIAMTTTKIWRLSHVPQFFRAAVTAGDGTTSLAVNLIGALR